VSPVIWISFNIHWLKQTIKIVTQNSQEAFLWTSIYISYRFTPKQAVADPMIELSAPKQQRMGFRLRYSSGFFIWKHSVHLSVWAPNAPYDLMHIYLFFGVGVGVWKCVWFYFKDTFGDFVNVVFFLFVYKTLLFFFLKCRA
jgi:hypothetical protein